MVINTFWMTFNWYDYLSITYIDPFVFKLVIATSMIQLYPSLDKSMAKSIYLLIDEEIKEFLLCTQVAKRRDGLLNYMLFLRLTPTLPNTFINVASPIVNVPYHTFLLATSIGLIPAAYVTVKV